MAHYVEIRYSDDGGNNWSNWRLLDKGDTGKFLTKLKAWRLGNCIDRIWEICDTSNVAASVLSFSYCINGSEDWQEIPLPDGTYSDSDRPWTDQDVVNQLPTPAEAHGARSAAKYPPVPGLQAFAAVGDGPHRGARDVEGKLFVVSGNKLFQVTPAGVSTQIGVIPGTGLVSMTHNQIANGNQLLIGTGSNSYVYNTVTGVLAATGVPLLSVDFLNQLVLGVDQARRFWRYSGLADATSWNTLDNESAESSPDRIVGGIVSQGEWLVFGERTIEPWSNTATQDTAFTRNTGAISERGCINANTIRRLDNTVFFVDNNFIPCRMQGYQPIPIAPKAIVDELSRCDPTKLSAYTWEDRGYVVYYITAQDGRTWGYDVTSQKWHRRESFGLDRWRLNTLFKWNGDWYGGDYTNGKLYRLTWGYVFEGCEIMPRRIRSGVLHNSGNRVFVHGVKLNVATGQAPNASPSDSPPSITGDMPEATVGDAVSYQYTITRAYPGQRVTLTVEGTLPTGLSLDANGLLSGTVTEAGTFNWSITPSTDCADGVALADSAVVLPAGYWWLTAGGSTDGTRIPQLWTSPDLASWSGPYVRSPNIDATYGPMPAGSAAIVVSNTGATERITDFMVSDGVTTTSVSIGLSSSLRFVRSFPGLLFASDQSGPYWLSVDDAASWTQYASPSGTLYDTLDLCKLDTGRWLTVSYDAGGPRQAWYSDQAVPTAWVSAGSVGNGECLVSSGTAAVLWCGGATSHNRTTSGASWASLTTAFTPSTSPRGVYDSDNGVFVMNGSAGKIARSTDNGVTFAEVALPAGTDVKSIRFDNGALLVTNADATGSDHLHKSTDGALTFTEVTLPYDRTPSTAGACRVAFIRHALT